MEKKNAWLSYSDEDTIKIEEISKKYIDFLSNNKIERECTEEIIKRAKAKGFRDLDECIKNKTTLFPGDKLYVNKLILPEYFRHLKANPLYEDTELAYFDTHYYGGIKKYQWVTLPLALHGVIVKKDGTKIKVVVGENENDPVVGISDLLPHLGQDQMKKEASKVVEGENLDILIGSKPIEIDEKENDGVKKNILNILRDIYGIEEDDFLSAEIEVVPAGRARDFGLDRSMVMAYGQDDKVCAYTSLEAFLEIEEPKRTISCILVDKEEIGSVGATGMESHFYENAISEICELIGETSHNASRRVLNNSKMLSSDVNAAYDPLYSDAFDKRNATKFGYGVGFCKYTGSRGKSGSNDADAEFIAEIRKIMDNNNIRFQISELGKVDKGGGGTIAYILANYNVKVIDCGVGVLSMHAPWEITSKSDIYEAYKCYIAFLKEA